jgi:peroxiredoxin-like protein
METVSQPKPRYRSFTYKTNVKWTGARAGELASEGKHTIRVSSPPEFKGEGGVWTPEDLFVASVEICHMMTFIAFAYKRGLPLVSYESHANGVLEFIDGDYRFTRIVLFPTVEVANTASESDVYDLLREAHKHCLVSNSIASIVEVNPTIIVV